MKEEGRKTFLIVAGIFLPVVIFIAIKAAPYFSSAGPGYLINGLFDDFSKTPLKIRIVKNTLPVVAIALFSYFIICLLIYTSIRNYRPEEEYGSDRWGSVSALNHQYSSKSKIFPELPWDRQDTILTQNIKMGFDFYRPEHQKNLNTLVWGGSGSWKSRGYYMPNILQANCNLVITDPKGELAAKTGDYLKKMGYKVKVFDTNSPDKSVCYNPFRYFRSEMDVLQFVNNFFASTEDKTAQKGEAFWTDQAKNLMLAFCYLLFYEAPDEEKNLPMVNELLLAAELDEEGNPSPVDLLFQRMEKEDPEHPAVKYYKSYHKGGPKTLMSIQSTLSSKLAYFNVKSISKLTYTDDIDIPSLAEEKVAIFCVIPDSDASLNFLVGTLYQQMFQQLYDLADKKYVGPLPRHIRFMMDEFANVALPDDYSKILSTMRSRNMSCAIALQDKSQIESLYKDLYKTIMANCNEWLFLGSNEKETCEYISGICGTETVMVKSFTKGGLFGMNNSTTITPQKRELITPGEVRRKAKTIAILIIEGEYAVKDKKYDVKKHPYYKYLAESENIKKQTAMIYNWGSTELASGTASVLYDAADKDIVDVHDIKEKCIKYDFIA